MVSKSFEKSLLHHKPPFTASVLLQSLVVCMKDNWLSPNTCLKLSLPQGFKRHNTSAVLADVSMDVDFLVAYLADNCLLLQDSLYLTFMWASVVA